MLSSPIFKIMLNITLLTAKVARVAAWQRIAVAEGGFY
jgi:hypothetical protein